MHLILRIKLIETSKRDSRVTQVGLDVICQGLLGKKREASEQKKALNRCKALFTNSQCKHQLEVERLRIRLCNNLKHTITTTSQLLSISLI